MRDIEKNTSVRAPHGLLAAPVCREAGRAPADTTFASASKTFQLRVDTVETNTAHFALARTTCRLSSHGCEAT